MTIKLFTIYFFLWDGLVAHGLKGRFTLSARKHANEKIHFHNRSEKKLICIFDYQLKRVDSEFVILHLEQKQNLKLLQPEIIKESMVSKFNQTSLTLLNVDEYVQQNYVESLQLP